MASFEVMIVPVSKMQYYKTIAEEMHPSQFPKINRFITERNFFYVKLMAVLFISGFLVLGIYGQWVLLQKQSQTQELLQGERMLVTKELLYWKQIAKQYDGYRDVYFRIATLEYSLGNTGEAINYLEKAIELDPNFEAARTLESKIING